MKDVLIIAAILSYVVATVAGLVAGLVVLSLPPLEDRTPLVTPIVQSRQCYCPADEGPWSEPCDCRRAIRDIHLCAYYYLSGREDPSLEEFCGWYEGAY